MLAIAPQYLHRTLYPARRTRHNLFSPAYQARLMALQQPTINSTIAHYHLAPNGSVALASPYSTAVLSPLGDSVWQGTDEDDEDDEGDEDEEDEEDEEDGEDLSPSGEHTDHGKDSTSEYLLGFPGGAAKTAPNDTPGSSSAPREHAARLTNTPHTAIAGPSKPSNGPKRTNGEDEDEGEDEDSRRNPKRQRRSRVGTPHIKLSVCPYQIRDPPTYALPVTPEVCGRGIRPGKLREHLRRHHLRPAQCLKCGRRGDSGQIKEHTTRGTCVRQSEIVEVPQEVLAIDEKLTLQPKTTWEDLWVLLFGPDVPLPEENQRYIRSCRLGGDEELVHTVLDWVGAELLQVFLRSERFKQLPANIRRIFEELLEEEVTASPQMESIAFMIEKANQKHENPRTEHRTRDLATTLTLPSTNMDPSKEVAPNEKLPQMFHPGILTGEGLTNGYSTRGFPSDISIGEGSADEYSAHGFHSGIPAGNGLADEYSAHGFRPSIPTGNDLADEYSAHGFHSGIPTGNGLADEYSAHGFLLGIFTGEGLTNGYSTRGFPSDISIGEGSADGYSAHGFHSGIPAGNGLADGYSAHGFHSGIPTGNGLADGYSAHTLSLGSEGDWQYGVPDDPTTGLTPAEGAPGAGTPDEG